MTSAVNNKNVIKQNTIKLQLADDVVDSLRWIKLRTIDLYTADGLAPFPVHISWVRSGILVVGMDNEMHVFSQWPDLDSPLAVGRSTSDGEAVNSGAAIKGEEEEENIAEIEKASVKVFCVNY